MSQQTATIFDEFPANADRTYITDKAVSSVHNPWSNAAAIELAIKYLLRAAAVNPPHTSHRVNQPRKIPALLRELNCIQQTCKAIYYAALQPITPENKHPVADVLAAVACPSIVPALDVPSLVALARKAGQLDEAVIDKSRDGRHPALDKVTLDAMVAHLALTQSAAAISALHGCMDGYILKQIASTDVLKTLASSCPIGFKTNAFDLNNLPFFPTVGANPIETLRAFYAHSAGKYAEFTRRLSVEVAHVQPIENMVTNPHAEMSKKRAKAKAAAWNTATLPNNKKVNHVFKSDEVKWAILRAQICGLDAFYIEQGCEAAFITITLPSKYHAGRNKDNTAWLEADCPTVAMAIAQLRRIVAKFHIDLKRRHTINAHGFMAIEAHADGTPHAHLTFYAQPDEMLFAEQLFIDTFGGGENEFKLIDTAAGSLPAQPASITTGNNCANVNDWAAKDKADEETSRAKAWHSLHKIRSFSFFGVNGFKGTWDVAFTLGKLLAGGYQSKPARRGIGMAANGEAYTCPIAQLAQAAYLGDGLTFFRLWHQYEAKLEKVTLNKTTTKMMLDGGGAPEVEFLHPMGARPVGLQLGNNRLTTVDAADFRRDWAKQKEATLEKWATVALGNAGMPIRRRANGAGSPVKAAVSELGISIQDYVDQLNQSPNFTFALKITQPKAKFYRQPAGFKVTTADLTQQMFDLMCSDGDPQLIAAFDKQIDHQNQHERGLEALRMRRGVRQQVENHMFGRAARDLYGKNVYFVAGAWEVRQPLIAPKNKAMAAAYRALLTDDKAKMA